MRNLNKIQPSKIKLDKDNIFLTFSLITNDISDLMYLHKLHLKNKQKNNIEGTDINAENGQATGRDIYLFRLIVSHFYSVLELLSKRKADINSNDDLQKILGAFNPKYQTIWGQYIQMSQDLMDNKIRPENKILRILDATRNRFTYHYYNSSKYLNEGCMYAFKDNTELNKKYAYVTVNEYLENRSYYIDLSFREYLKLKSGVNTELEFNEIEKEILNDIIRISSILGKIIEEYHKKLII